MNVMNAKKLGIFALSMVLASCASKPTREEAEQLQACATVAVVMGMLNSVSNTYGVSRSDAEDQVVGMLQGKRKIILERADYAANGGTMATDFRIPSDDDIKSFVHRSDLNPKGYSKVDWDSKMESVQDDVMKQCMKTMKPMPSKGIYALVKDQAERVVKDY